MIPFVGPSYTLRVKRADVQRAVNLYPVVNELIGGKTLAFMAPVPGLDVFSPDVLFYTSWLYPLDPLEQMNLAPAVPQSGSLAEWPNELFNLAPAIPQSGTLVSILQTYSNAAPEQFNLAPAVPQSGTLVSTLQVYSNAAPEEFNLAPATPQSGTLVVTLVSYTNAAPETMDLAPAFPVGGTLV